MLALLSAEGVLTDSLTASVDLQPTDSVHAPADQLIPQFESPDAPPPRA
jgi:hypothetical protein